MKKILSLLLILSFSCLLLASCDLMTPGDDGKDGLSAYEVALSEGFVGTEAEWIASLYGKDGTPSDKVPEIRDGYWYVDGENTGVKATAGAETNIETTKEAPLAGKTIVNFGDSIFGTANKEQPRDTISYFLAGYTGATVYNMGFGGCRMSKHPSTKTTWDAFSMYRLADAICTGDFSYQEDAFKKEADKETADLLPYFEKSISTLKTIDFNEVDIITIGFGTNDFTGDVTIDNDSGYDCTTLLGAMRYSVELIQRTYPHIAIFICTPTYRAWLGSAPDYPVTKDSGEYTNGKGNCLGDFTSALYECAAEYNLPVIDLYSELGINRHNRAYYFPKNDGTHHNIFGRMLIAKKIADELF